MDFCCRNKRRKKGMSFPTEQSKRGELGDMFHEPVVMPSLRWGGERQPGPHVTCTRAPVPLRNLQQEMMDGKQLVAASLSHMHSSPSLAALPLPTRPWVFYFTLLLLYCHSHFPPFPLATRRLSLASSPAFSSSPCALKLPHHPSSYLITAPVPFICS